MAIKRCSVLSLLFFPVFMRFSTPLLVSASYRPRSSRLKYPFLFPFLSGPDHPREGTKGDRRWWGKLDKQCRKTHSTTKYSTGDNLSQIRKMHVRCFVWWEEAGGRRNPCRAASGVLNREAAHRQQYYLNAEVPPRIPQPCHAFKHIRKLCMSSCSLLYQQAEMGAKGRFAHYYRPWHCHAENCLPNNGGNRIWQLANEACKSCKSYLMNSTTLSL